MTKLCCHQLVKSSLISRRRNYEVLGNVNAKVHFDFYNNDQSIFLLFLAYDVMGPLGKLWIEVCIIGYNMGCCIAYLVVLGDLGPEILNKIGMNFSLHSARIVLMTGI